MRRLLCPKRGNSPTTARGYQGGRLRGKCAEAGTLRSGGEVGGGLKTAFYKTAIKLIPGENMVPLKCGIGWTSDGKGENGMAILVGALAVAAVIITGKLTYRDMVRSD